MHDSKVLGRLRDMGYDPNVSIEDIDAFANECIDFLRREQAMDSHCNFENDIFEIESSRQKAILHKYCRNMPKKE